MPRITGLLKKAGSSSVPAAQQVKNFSFTVSGQDSAKTNTDAISRQYPVVNISRLVLSDCPLTSSSPPPRLTTPMTRSWWELEAPGSELPSVWWRKASRRPSSRSCSPPGPTLWPPREASTLLWATWSLTTGGGTCTTLSRDLIGWEIRTPSTT